VHIITFRFQRITRRQGVGAGGVLYHTLEKPMTQPTKLAKESELLLLFNKRYVYIASYNYLK